MKHKLVKSYTGTQTKEAGSGIPLGLLSLIFIIFFVMMKTDAQDPIPPISNVPPPPGHSLDCLSDATALFYLGPNCVSPVTWDIEGLNKLGTWAFFDDTNGVSTAGFVVGFVWNWRTQTYDLLLLTREHDAISGYAGQFEIVPVPRISYP